MFGLDTPARHFDHGGEQVKSHDIHRIERQIAERREDGGGFLRRLTRRIKGEDAAVLERLRAGADDDATPTADGRQR
jgi:hypothetical protein